MQNHHAGVSLAAAVVCCFSGAAFAQNEARPGPPSPYVAPVAHVHAAEGTGCSFDFSSIATESILANDFAALNAECADITGPDMGWSMRNNSSPAGTNTWFRGNDQVFVAHAGADDSYIGVNFNSVAGANTISNWLLSPVINFTGTTELSFFTRGPAGSTFPDRLEVRLCTGDPCTSVGAGPNDVGDFTDLLLTINGALNQGGYPTGWTQFTLSTAGLDLPASGSGRVAFRYFVTNGGPNGANSDFIGIDSVSITGATLPVELQGFSVD